MSGTETIRLPADIVAARAQSLQAQILRLFDTVDNNRWEGLTDVFHPGVVYDRPGYPSLVGCRRVIGFYAHERIIDSGQHRLEQIVVSGSYAACWGLFVGKLKDGSFAEERFADAYFFDGTLIRSRRSFFFRPAV